AKYITRTTWGVASPEALLRDTQQPISTPTPIYQGLRAVNHLPDLRVLRNIPDQKLLNLDDYIQHGRISKQDLKWNIVTKRGLPLWIDQDHHLICEDFPFTGDYGYVILSVSDGDDTLLLKTKI